MLVAQIAPPGTRERIPEHLTLVSQGIVQTPEASGALSRWSDPAEVGREETGPTLAATWEPEVSASTLAEWNRAASLPRAFSSRPINAWSGQSSYQVQSASYTFER